MHLTLSSVHQHLFPFAARANKPCHNIFPNCHKWRRTTAQQSSMTMTYGVGLLLSTRSNIKRSQRLVKDRALHAAQVYPHTKYNPMRLCTKVSICHNEVPVFAYLCQWSLYIMSCLLDNNEIQANYSIHAEHSSVSSNYLVDFCVHQPKNYKVQY